MSLDGRSLKEQHLSFVTRNATVRAPTPSPTPTPRVDAQSVPATPTTPGGRIDWQTIAKPSTQYDDDGCYESH
jgi:hypothetical protein